MRKGITRKLEKILFLTLMDASSVLFCRLANLARRRILTRIGMSVYDRRNVYKLDLNTQPMGNKFRKSKDAIPLTTDKYPEKMGGKVMPKMDPKLPTLVVCKKDLDRNLR